MAPSIFAHRPDGLHFVHDAMRLHKRQYNVCPRPDDSRAASGGDSARKAAGRESVICLSVGALL